MKFKKYHISKNLWNEEYTNISPILRYVPIYVGEGSFTLSTTTPYDSNVANLFLLSGNVTTGASTSINGVWLNHNVTLQSVNGYVTIAYRHYSDTTSPTECETMLNIGLEAFPYEPYSTEVWHDIPHYIYNAESETWKEVSDVHERTSGQWD